jgi:hypothetical protein
MKFITKPEGAGWDITRCLYDEIINSVFFFHFVWSAADISNNKHIIFKQSIAMYYN